MLTGAFRILLINYFRTIFIPLLWEIEKTVNTLITFFSLPIKISLNGLLKNVIRAFVNISLIKMTLYYIILIMELIAVDTQFYNPHLTSHGG